MTTPNPPATYDDLSAIYINCTLKPSPEPSHTELLSEASMQIMRSQGVRVTSIRAVDYDIAPGVQPDMTTHGFPNDEWPKLQQQVMDADILILTTPIWLGEKSSVASRVIERLYSYSGKLNDAGQYDYYGRVGGCLITGNEDGIKHVAMSTLYALQHLGYVIPPQADAGWIGEAGPGPSYGEPQSDGTPAGFDNAFTQKNVTFMTWNLLHLARIIKNAGGIPAYGNQRTAWESGERFGFKNPEYR